MRRHNPLNKSTKKRKDRSAQFAGNVQRLNYTNAKFASGDKVFIVCCEKAGIKPSKRQAAAFRHGCGAAFAQLKNLKPEDTAPVVAQASAQ
jgi:hypothetical protein